MPSDSDSEHGIGHSLRDVLEARNWIVGVDFGLAAPDEEVPYVHVNDGAFEPASRALRDALVDVARELFVGHCGVPAWADLLQGGKLRFVNKENGEDWTHGDEVLCVVKCPDFTAAIMRKETPMSTTDTATTPTAQEQSFALVPSNAWTASRDNTVSTLGSITRVDSSAAYDAATATLSVAKKLRRELETERKLVTSRLDAAKKALIAREREIAASLDAEIERVMRLASDYAAAEMRRRQEEERRIEEERRRAAEAALAAQEAADAAAESGVDPDPFGIGAPSAPVAVEAVEAVPVPAAERPRGVVMRTRVQVVDESRIPREFLSFDEKKALAWAKYQKSLGARVSDLRADGLRFFEEPSIVSR